MGWVRLDDDTKEEDEPRSLTKSEIDYIVSYVPYVEAPTREVMIMNRDGVVSRLRVDLSRIKLCPSCIEEMRDMIVFSHNNSLSQKGTAIGFLPSEALGASLTQGVLNTFHHSGSAVTAGSSVDRAKDIIFAREKPSIEILTIYFTDKTLTYEEVLNTRRYIVASYISDFVKDFDIDYKSEMEQYYWSNEDDNDVMVLRLFLDKIEMYKHRVRIDQIVSCLELDKSNTLKYMYGSFDDGILDLYLDHIPGNPQSIKILTDFKGDVDILRESLVSDSQKSGKWKISVTGKQLKESRGTIDDVRRLVENSKIKISKVSDLNIVVESKSDPIDIIDSAIERANNILSLMEKNYLITVKSELSKIRVKGIVGIKSLYPAVAKTTNAFHSSYEKSPGIWEIALKETFLKESGIKVKSLESLIKESKLKIVSSTDFSITVKAPREPIVLINQAINAAKAEMIEKRDNEIINNNNNQVGIVIDRPNIVKLSEYVIAEAEGNSLLDLISMDEIDSDRTTCNNMFTIANVFGIENARRFIIKQLTKIIIGNGSYIHPFNILMFGEMITNRGVPYGANYIGVSKQSAGFVSLLSIERAMNTVAQAALSNSFESGNNITPSVYNGSRVKVGTGSFDIGCDVKIDGKVKTFLNDRTANAYSNDVSVRKIGAIGAEAEDQGEYDDQPIIQRKMGGKSLPPSVGRPIREFIPEIVKSSKIKTTGLITVPDGQVGKALRGIKIVDFDSHTEIKIPKAPDIDVEQLREENLIRKPKGEFKKLNLTKLTEEANKKLGF